MTSDVAFELAPVGLAELALDWRFTRCNARLCAMLGLSRGALLAHTLNDHAHTEEIATANARFAELLSRKMQTCVWDQRMRRADGTWRWIEIALSLSEGSDFTHPRIQPGGRAHLRA